MTLEQQQFVGCVIRTCRVLAIPQPEMHPIDRGVFITWYYGPDRCESYLEVESTGVGWRLQRLNGSRLYSDCDGFPTQFVYGWLSVLKAEMDGEADD